MSSWRFKTWRAIVRLDERSISGAGAVILTYALCGFCQFFVHCDPDRWDRIDRSGLPLGPRSIGPVAAVVAGNLAAYMTHVLWGSCFSAQFCEDGRGCRRKRVGVIAANSSSIWSVKPERLRSAGVQGVVDFAVVLGSACPLRRRSRAPSESPADLPGFKSATVKGTEVKARLRYDRGLSGPYLLGRMHLYEGIEPWRAGILPRLAAALGARVFMVTNASGGISGKGLEPGDLMRITDQINLQGANPLVGDHDERLEARFPDMGQPYDRQLGACLDEARLVARRPP